MNKVNIQQLDMFKQDAREGVLTMKGLSLTRLLHNIIREYGAYQNNSYAVNLSELSQSDKKLLLSHIIDADEYQEACNKPFLAEALFQEHEDYLWKLIDRECDEIYHEDMEEKRAYA